MGRHAYLILAHGDTSMLCRLLHALDDNRNDIYIHYDSKYHMEDSQKKSLQDAAKKSKLFFVEPISVNWGGYSIIQAQLILINAAVKAGYDYYHFLSGADYPIKSQDYIHRFFDKNSGKEFVEFWERDNYTYRVKYYYPYQEQIGTYSYDVKTLILRVKAKLNLLGQRLKKTDRLKDYDGEWKIGSNWCSFTHKFATYLIENEGIIYKLFHDGLAVDELYIQTLLWNSDFKNKNCEAKTRLIDWDRGRPYVWQAIDIDELMSSSALWARKISDPELTKLIDSKIGERND